MGLDKIIDSVKSTATADSSDEDIVELIFEDHRPLKEFIEVMKDLDQPLEKRREAAENFAIQLVAHSEPEERILYSTLKKVEALKTEAFEAETEHSLADQLLEEVKRTTDEDTWSAKVKVLAELVEHHIEEEENELLPNVRAQIELGMRERLGNSFLEEKSKIFERGGDNAPPEQTVELH